METAAKWLLVLGGSIGIPMLLKEFIPVLSVPVFTPAMLLGFGLFELGYEYILKDK